jgi:hypothetical protein
MSRKLENSWVILWWIWNTYHSRCLSPCAEIWQSNSWVVDRERSLNCRLWVDSEHRSSSEGTLAGLSL